MFPLSWSPSNSNFTIGAIFLPAKKLLRARLIRASAWFYNAKQAHDLKILVGKTAKNRLLYVSYY